MSSSNHGSIRQNSSELPYGPLTFALLLEVAERFGAIDAPTRGTLLSQEQRLRANFLREKYGPRKASQYKDAKISAPELLVTAKIPHPDLPDQYIDEDVIARWLAKLSGGTYVKIDPLELDMNLVTTALPRGFAERHLILPLKRKGTILVVAICDPFDRAGVEDFSRATGVEIEWVVSTKSDISNVINQVYGFRKALSGAVSDATSINLQNLEQLVRVRNADEIDPGDHNIVAAVEYLLNTAFDNRASDIHVEPKREISRLRLRIDGVLHDIGDVPSSIQPALAARIKILARMDIAEKRRPQDGRIKTQRGSREIELRVSSLPVAFGEKIVIRIFDPQVLLADIKDLGFAQKDWDLYRRWITEPHGLVLVTGPTGSGKTTTLYSTLKYIAKTDINIMTVEDPIEMVYEPLNQVSVQPKIDVTFSSALRTILRQDPDVIMVGEIRDAETALMTVQAALTGHLVFSTVHTNDTASSVSRMIDLGVEPFLLGSTLCGVIAQRLLRRVCSSCAQDTYLSDEQVMALGLSMTLDDAKKLPVKVGQGCIRCRNTGLYGRTGIFELLDITPEIRDLIAKGVESKEIKRVAMDGGMTTLRQAALRKLAKGQTIYEEVFRVTSELFG